MTFSSSHIDLGVPAPRLPSYNIPPIGARRKPLAEAVQKAAEKAPGAKTVTPHRRTCANDGEVEAAFAVKTFTSQGSLADASRRQLIQRGAVLLAALDIADDAKPSRDIRPLQPAA